ncbi:type II toxin-antitoxin system PemK/MazF family toxin [Enterococcus sp.]|uniref:type II toxin-antitoxin system PemK/MazF family toxin n=1 Tax=Enterococcus sp. TaxID=35783 RepID=UPI0028976BAC|nr:type II toxin-antitoxin system PemK/MazF family toxin [Enterococcus sp.]
MKTNEIVTVYVGFAHKTGGKRRPILVLRDPKDRIEFFGITSQYESKSESIKRVYFPILDWDKAGLKKQSWIDVGTIRALNKDKKNIIYNKVGHLTNPDMIRLNHFLAELYGTKE